LHISFLFWFLLLEEIVMLGPRQTQSNRRLAEQLNPMRGAFGRHEKEARFLPGFAQFA
jgi:hypothetical protein